VGTFKIVNGRKTGGNVASYFCTADGRVLHAIAGPVDAETLLRESKWVLEIHEQAKKAGKEGDADYVKVVRQAHADRLGPRSDSARLVVYADRSPLAVAVHRLLADQALDEIEKVSPKVWEGILKEKFSNEPISLHGYGR
jgi:hypothetical protein